MSVQLSLYLKEGTKSTHDQAETSDFQRRLANAEISRKAYADYIGQLYLVHSALEKGLAGDARTKEIADPAQFQAEFLARDLNELGIDTTKIEPLPSTKRMLASIAENAKSHPLGLIGYHYVLLGSKHGGKYIAAQVRKKFDFDGAGCLYFDPYGTNFQSIWAQFKSNLDGVTADECDGAAVLQSAKEMFNYVGELGHDLSSVE